MTSADRPRRIRRGTAAVVIALCFAVSMLVAGQSFGLFMFTPPSKSAFDSSPESSGPSRALYSVGKGADLQELKSNEGKRFRRVKSTTIQPDIDFKNWPDRKFPDKPVSRSGLSAYDTNRSAWGGVKLARKSGRRCGG